jgi:hypothetical protein
VTDEPRKRPPTLSDQLAAQHELVMALATKSAPRGSQSVSFKLVTVGDLKGKYVCDGYNAIRDEGEDWPQFVGRVEQELRDVDAAVIRVNASAIERELAATLEKGGKS